MKSWIRHWMSVNDYIDQFTDWKDRMEAHMFSTDELSYVEDYNSGLDYSICIRVRTSLLKPINLSTAYSIARIEEAMMSIESFWGTEHMKDESHNLFDKMHEPDSAAGSEEQHDSVVSNGETIEYFDRENKDELGGEDDQNDPEPQCNCSQVVLEDEACHMFEEMHRPTSAADEVHNVSVISAEEQRNETEGEIGQPFNGIFELPYESSKKLEDDSVKFDNILNQVTKPRWIFDGVKAFNVIIKCKVDGVLPPHLSLFVDNEAEGRVPDYATTIKRLQAVAGKEVLQMTGMGTEELANPQRLLVESFILLFDPGGSLINDKGMDCISQAEDIEFSNDPSDDLLHQDYSFPDYMDPCLSPSYADFGWDLYTKVKQVRWQHFENIYDTVVDIYGTVFPPYFSLDDGVLNLFDPGGYGFSFLFAGAAAVLSELGSQLFMVIIDAESYIQVVSAWGIRWVLTMPLLVHATLQHYFGGFISEKIVIYVEVPVSWIYTLIEPNELVSEHFLMISCRVPSPDLLFVGILGVLHNSFVDQFLNAASTMISFASPSHVSFIFGFLSAAYILFDGGIHFLFDPGGNVNLNVDYMLKSVLQLLFLFEESSEVIDGPTQGEKFPKGVLCISSPEPGRTMLARAKTGLIPFFPCNARECEEMLVIFGPCSIMVLFAAAKTCSPGAIYINEIDVIGESKDTQDHQYIKMSWKLLVELDGFKHNEGIIVIAATNFPYSMDQAHCSPSFYSHVVVPNVYFDGRRQILESHMSKILQVLEDVAALKDTIAGTKVAQHG